METESPCVSEQRLCSVFARNAGDDPIGTASNYDLFLIMEMNLPWLGLWYEAKSASRELVDTLKRARERGVRARPLAIAPDPEYSQPGQTRVLVYRRPDSPFSRYEKEEFVVPEDRLVPLLEAYLNQLGSLGQFEEFRRQTQHIRELFVCTHGSVDVCCGTFGYPAYQILRNRYAGTELRVWRTSHFGGHAFAPTLFDMPEGRWWGHLDPEHLKALVHRSEAVSSLRQCYRGWGGLSFFGQVAEREIFIREGWGWSSLLKSETILNVTGGEPLDPGQSPRYASNPPVSARVRIDFTSPDGAVSGAYEATIELKGQVFTMGSTGDQKLLRANQYHVTSLERL